MRRAPVVIAATAAGFAGVVAMHAGARSSVLGGPAPSVAPGNLSPATTRPTGSNTAPAGEVTTALGNKEQYGYGVLSVRVTFRGGRITDVSVANLQTAE